MDAGSHDKINNVVAPDGGAHVCVPRKKAQIKGYCSASFFLRKADQSTDDQPLLTSTQPRRH